MFYLLVVLIAIALIGIVTATTSSYIGDAFQSGNADAQASALINAGQQISSAWKLYQVQDPAAEGASSANISDLVSRDYLSTAPKIATQEYDMEVMTVSGYDIIETQNKSPEAPTCSAINEQAGFSATSEVSADRLLDNNEGQFGCTEFGFFYRL